VQEHLSPGDPLLALSPAALYRVYFGEAKGILQATRTNFGACCLHWFRNLDHFRRDLGHLFLNHAQLLDGLPSWTNVNPYALPLLYGILLLGAAAHAARRGWREMPWQRENWRVFATGLLVFVLPSLLTALIYFSRERYLFMLFVASLVLLPTFIPQGKVSRTGRDTLLAAALGLAAYVAAPRQLRLSWPTEFCGAGNSTRDLREQFLALRNEAKDTAAPQGCLTDPRFFGIHLRCTIETKAEADVWSTPGALARYLAKTSPKYVLRLAHEPAREAERALNQTIIDSMKAAKAYRFVLLGHPPADTWGLLWIHE